MKLFPILFLFAGGASLSGCIVSPTQHSEPPAQVGWEASVGQPGAVLYGRDGTPVGASAAPAAMSAGPQGVTQPQATITATEDMPHRPQDAVGSRPVLLELYQTVVTEKEALEFQLEATQEALQSTEDRMFDLEKRLEEEIRAREAADQSRKQFEEQVFEIGRRLSVAQMRRLEAEKLLLEKTLAERRQLAEEGQ